MVATTQFICQVREPIACKQPEQEMLADSRVDTLPGQFSYFALASPFLVGVISQASQDDA
jgi:hypothetical protein